MSKLEARRKVLTRAAEVSLAIQGTLPSDRTTALSLIMLGLTMLEASGMGEKELGMTCGALVRIAVAGRERS